MTQARTTKKVGGVIRDWREVVEGRLQELPSLDFDIQGEAEDGVWHLYPAGFLSGRRRRSEMSRGIQGLALLS